MTISRCILFSCLAMSLLANTSCFSKRITSKPVAITAPKDSDLDGVNDSEDKCPDVKGLIKLEGCPDMDGDGIADYLDKCPDIPGQARYQGCPVPDTDKDGINDDVDQCPTVFGYARYQGCLIPDTDGDGVNDEEDKCVNEPGPASNKGCPLKNMRDSLANLDTDGDGVIDLDDKCLNEPGPASNNGCPLMSSKKSSRKTDSKIKIAGTKNSPTTSKSNKELNNNKRANSTRNINSTSGEKTIAGSENNGTGDSIQTPVPYQSATFRFSYPVVITGKGQNELVIDLMINQIAVNATKDSSILKLVAPIFIKKNDSTINFEMSDITTYKKLTLSFLYNNEEVGIRALVPEKQETDLMKGNSWRWHIDALKSKPDLDTITLLLEAETAEGLKINVAQHQVKIKIAPAPVSFWSGAGKWMISIGLVALFTTFFFVIAKRKKKEKKPLA